MTTKDENQRRLASTLMNEANKTVTVDRGNQHGGAENSFAMIGELWSTYVRHTTEHRTQTSNAPVSYIQVTPADVAQMMVLLKVSRSVYGNPGHKDHYVDEIGYSALAGSLAMSPPSTNVSAEEVDRAATEALAKKLAPNGGKVPTAEIPPFLDPNKGARHILPEEAK